MNEGNGADEAMDDDEKVIWQAEASKARLYATPGKDFDHLPNWQSGQRQNNALFVTVVDKNYLVIGSHIDPNLQLKIINNEYVDFARLIPKHGVAANGNYDQRMELVSKGGYTYFVPVSECESVHIGNFGKWEQVFSFL